ncbi:MAG: hypothetical protein P1P72_08145 [ANME-2 cluster archaeon]|nr:hypothetical protein [ANME-2 cluster archaeon]
MEVRAYITKTPGFTKFHDIMEEYLEEYPDKFVEGELKKYSELDPSLESAIYSEFFYIKNEFPILLRYSFLVTCYSYFEHELIQECDSKVSGIEEAKNYLINDASIDFSIDKSWNEILDIKKIRNCIVHSEGILDDCRFAKHIRNYISRRHDIFIENDRIILSADYCKYVINVLDRILRILKTLKFSRSLI